VLDPQDSNTVVDAGNSPTLSALATQAGVILGTAAYMSPEQAKGKQVDRRADIWAFGCVLYEMLSGQKPFDGETISDVLAAVIMRDPDWNTLPATIPPPIQNLIQRCMVKDPKQRLRDIGDARIAIDETISGTRISVAAQQGRDSQASGTTLESLESSAQRRGLLQRVLPWVTVATTLGMVIFAVAYFTKSQVSVGPIRSLIAAPKIATFSFDGTRGGPVLSPDGKRLIFPATDASGKESLWVRPLDSLTAQRLEGTDGATYPFWSPDSRYLGFFQDGKLKKIDVTGGPPVLLCDAPDARGGAWSKSDIIVFAPKVMAGGLESVPAAGGTPSPVATHKASGGMSSNRWPEFLPDGKHFLYLSGDLSAPGTSRLGIYLGAVGTDEEKFLIQADSDALYAPPGYLLFLRGDTLMAQKFDAGSQKLEGEVFPVAEHVASPAQFRLGTFSVSRTGLLVFSGSGAGSAGGQLVWVDANGKEMNKVGPQGVFFPRLSPDGKRVAYGMSEGSGSPDLWLMDLERGVQTRFTFNPGGDIYPVWSPDGSRVVYTSLRKGFYNIYVKNASGAGSAEPLVESDEEKIPSNWSRDGRYLSYEALDPKGKTKIDIWVVPLTGNHKPFPFLQTPFNEGDAMFSPNGHWMAYDSDQSGNFEVYLSPFPAGGSKWQVSQGGGVQPIWSRDGSKLYFVAPGGKLMVASIKEDGSAVTIGTPQELFQVQLQDQGDGGQAYDVAPDGKRFLVDKAEQGASPPLTLVTNWTSMVKSR
jgi:Tol biopolymer transport system component